MRLGLGLGVNYLSNMIKRILGYLIDDSGNYLTDDSGNKIIGVK